MIPIRFRPRLLLAASSLVFVLSACGGSHPSTSQVAVKVNGDEISVHQLNEHLARISAAGLTDEQKLVAQKNTLEGLVDQQLLIEQAKAKQLDRDPQIVSAMEAARAQVLAEAYVARQIMPNAKPSDAEIQKYYDDNPDLFSARRVYALQEALIPEMSIEQRDEVKKRLAASSNNLEEALKWLKAQGVKMTANMGVRPAEQVPLFVLPKIAHARDGSIQFIEGPNGGANIIKVVSSQPAPVDEKSARSTIEQYLGKRKREELVRAEIKRLRDAAKIDYVGEFQKLAMTPAAGSDAASPAGGAAAASASPAAAEGKASDAIAKGLKGL